jgi:hypothetical protein
MILFSLLRKKRQKRTSRVELGVRYVSEHFPNGGSNGGCNGGHSTPSEAGEDEVNSPIGARGDFTLGNGQGNGDIYYNKDPQIWMVLKGQSHEKNFFSECLLTYAYIC